jgi:hypothetical protein
MGILSNTCQKSVDILVDRVLSSRVKRDRLTVYCLESILLKNMCNRKRLFTVLSAPDFRTEINLLSTVDT